MNQIQLMGRLTRDPETTITTKDDKLMVYITVAVDSNWAKDKSNFIFAKAFGKQAELIANHFHKGNRIAIVGELTSYEDRENKTQYSVEINKVHFVDTKAESAQTSPAIAAINQKVETRLVSATPEIDSLVKPQIMTKEDEEKEDARIDALNDEELSKEIDQFKKDVPWTKEIL